MNYDFLVHDLSFAGGKVQRKYRLKVYVNIRHLPKELNFRCVPATIIKTSGDCSGFSFSHVVLDRLRHTLR